MYLKLVVCCICVVCCLINAAKAPWGSHLRAEPIIEPGSKIQVPGGTGRSGGFGAMYQDRKLYISSHALALALAHVRNYVT